MKTYDEFLSDVNGKIDVRRRQNERKKKVFLGAGAVCCLLAVLVALPFIVKFLASPDVSYRVMLDVNPSVEIDVGKGDEVVGLRAFNEDGEKIVRDMDTGHSVEETVKDAIERMVDAGYLSDEANSVLLSVVSDDETVAREKEDALRDGVVDSLKEKEIDGAVLSQTVSEDEAATLQKDSDAYLMSPGRVMLINSLLAQNSLKTFDELSALTVNELNLLRVSYQIDAAKTQSVGSAATVKYLGEDNAISLALAAVNVPADSNEVTDLACRFDCVSSVLLYEVTLTYDGEEYRIRLNAVTGEILLADHHAEGAIVPGNTGDKPVATVGEEAVIAAALEHAKMKDTELLSLTCKGDWVDGRSVFIVSFSDSTYNCKYTYCATDGTLLQYYKNETPVGRALDVKVVGMSAAKATALAANGLTDGHVSKFVATMKRDWLNGVYTYEMTFLCAGKKYAASVNALTGELLTSAGEAIPKDSGVPSGNPDAGSPSAEG